jgi:hypothetical protein
MKKSIDKAIGENRWMTTSLASKLAKPRKKKKQYFFFIPTFFTIAVAAITFFLINSELKEPAFTQSALQDANILNYVEENALGQAVLDYLYILEEKDVEKVIELGKGFYDEQTATELLKKYEHVDYSSISLLNVAQDPNAPFDTYVVYITLKEANSSSTLLHSLNVEHTDDVWYVHEFTQGNFIAYEPFTAPSYLGFHYESAPAYEKDNSYQLKDLALAYPSIQVTAQISAHFYEQGSDVMLVLQKGDDYYPISNVKRIELGSAPHAYGIELIENKNGLDYYTMSSLEQSNILTFYYNKSIEKFQALSTEPGATAFFADVDGNEIYEIFINNKLPLVATVEVGQLVVSNPTQNFEPHIVESFLTMEYSSHAIMITYKDVHGEKYANYTWKTVNEAPFLNNSKMQGDN